MDSEKALEFLQDLDTRERDGVTLFVESDIKVLFIRSGDSAICRGVIQDKGNATGVLSFRLGLVIKVEDVDRPTEQELDVGVTLITEELCQLPLQGSEDGFNGAHFLLLVKPEREEIRIKEGKLYQEPITQREGALN